jgi:hypothetical protein
MHLDDLLERLWRDYLEITPQAARIHELLEARGERILNDHIALRTYDLAGVGIDALAAPFRALGYREGGAYTFPEKRLRARHYEHLQPGRPKVFISELEVQSLPAAVADAVRALVAAAPAVTELDAFPACGRPWPLSCATYDALADASEYASWVAAFGFRANHFTIDVGALRSFADLASLNEFLLDHGFSLNRSGGVIKGGKEVYLEQSSTLADRIEVEFDDGRRTIPSCYYEFARRYPLPSGEIFQGFVPTSADRLFESTDRDPRT